ncbi:MAG: hypothetical protein EBT86_03045 [Actinobacteria bacterium]|nr:hypothetical protein [Actinomycetota bacterium]
MSVWQEKTADIQKKIKAIYNDPQARFGIVIGNWIAKTSLENLITSGGLKNPTESENKIKQMNMIIQDIENNIITPLSRHLRESTKTLDISSLLGKTGQLQQEIVQLRDQMKLVKEDAENQIARDSVLRNAEGSVSKHQIFLFGRPIRQNSIPYLWMAASLFFFLGFAAIMLMAPRTGETNIFGFGSALGKATNSISSYIKTDSYGPSIGEQFTAIFGNYYVIGLTIFSLTVVIAVLILKIMGKLG